MITLIKNKGISFYFELILIVCNVATIIYLATHIGHYMEYPTAIALLSVGILLEGFVSFFPTKKMEVIMDVVAFFAVVITALGYAIFMCRGCMNLFDAYAHVTYWGDPKQATNTIIFASVGVGSTLVGIIGTYLR